jgi:cytochrome bd ubiquinol oxidase subunit I
MIGSVVTASFVMASLGAFYVLNKKQEQYGRLFVRTGVLAGLVSIMLMIFPTGDGQGKMVAQNQPVTLAAMEGLFESIKGAPVVLVGQPNTFRLALDNPIEVPDVLSFLTYKRWNAEVRGLKEFPQNLWPDNIPLLYYAYHIMVGLGTMMAAVMGLSVPFLWRERLFSTPALLWTLMLSIPFPYIATIAGWMTAELGRQPWLVYGLMRTADGASPNVSAGNSLFSLLGFMGMYMVLGILFLFLVAREIGRGPAPERDQFHENAHIAADGELLVEKGV